MFTVNELGQVAQRTVCMLLSAVIVAASLSLGALGAQAAAAHDGYSVTVTQLS